MWFYMLAAITYTLLFIWIVLLAINQIRLNRLRREIDALKSRNHSEDKQE